MDLNNIIIQYLSPQEFRFASKVDSSWLFRRVYFEVYAYSRMTYAHAGRKSLFDGDLEAGIGDS